MRRVSVRSHPNPTPTREDVDDDRELQLAVAVSRPPRSRAVSAPTVVVVTRKWIGQGSKRHGLESLSVTSCDTLKSHARSPVAQWQRG